MENGTSVVLREENMIKVTQIINDYVTVGTEWKKAEVKVEYEFYEVAEAMKLIESMTVHSTKPCMFNIERTKG